MAHDGGAGQVKDVDVRARRQNADHEADLDEVVVLRKQLPGTTRCKGIEIFNMTLYSFFYDVLMRPSIRAKRRVFLDRIMSLTTG